MRDLEDQIRRYADHADALVPGIALPPTTSPRRRWPVLATAAAVIVVAVIAAAVARIDGGEDEVATSTGEGPQAPTPWTWRPIAEAPIEPTVNPISVWTGDEMIVVGGSRTAVARETGADGVPGDTPIRIETPDAAAAYDPVTNSWRVLAAPPAAAPEGEALVPDGEAVWTGEEVLVVTSTKVLTYDLDADTWSTYELPLPSGSFGLWPPVVVWTGDELLIWAYQHRLFDQPGFFFGFDPESGEFRQLDMGPLDYRWWSSGRMADEHLVLVGGAGNSVSSDPAALDGAVFDLATETWTELEPGPLPAALSNPWVVDTQGEVVVLGGFIAAAGTHGSAAAALSGSTRSWRVVSDEVAVGANTSGAAAWTGDEVVVVDSPSAHMGEDPGPSSGALDPNGGTWRVLPDVPGGAACGSTGVWTGTEFIVWGGSVGCTEISSPRSTGYRMSTVSAQGACDELRSCDDQAGVESAGAQPTTPAAPSLAETGGVDGPVMYGPKPESDRSEDALIEGRLEREGDCLYVSRRASPELRYPVLWRYGTRWQEDSESVVLPDGVMLPVGGEFSAGGGFHAAETLEPGNLAPEAVERANDCAEGEFREVAVVQTQVEVR